MRIPGFTDMDEVSLGFADSARSQAAPGVASPPGAAAPSVDDGYQAATHTRVRTQVGRHLEGPG
eukprot:11191747-Lingulodinium_polyedra.AAC.1